MHEHSLLNDLVKKITALASEQEAKRVLAVKVKLGALSHISPEHFRYHFDQAVKDTLIENAELEVEQLEDQSDPYAQDIILDSIEIEE